MGRFSIAELLAPLKGRVPTTPPGTAAGRPVRLCPAPPCEHARSRRVQAPRELREPQSGSAFAARASAARLAKVRSRRLRGRLQARVGPRLRDLFRAGFCCTFLWFCGRYCCSKGPQASCHAVPRAGARAVHACAGRMRCGPRVRVDGPATVTEQVCAGRPTKMSRPDACPVFPGPASAGSREQSRRE